MSVNLVTLRMAFLAVLPIPLLHIGAPQSFATKPLLRSALSGESYDLVVASQNPRTGGQEQITLRAHGQSAGMDLRLDILESSGPATPGSPAKGNFILIKGGGSKVLLVDPAKKIFYDIDPKKLTTAMGVALRKLPGVTFEVGDFRFDAEKVGPGELIEGYPTEHWRTTQKLAVKMEMLGETMTMVQEGTSDYYFAPSLKLGVTPDAIQRNGAAAIANVPGFDTPALRKKLAEFQAKLPTAPALRVVTQMKMSMGGQETPMMTRSELKNLHPANVPQSAFQIPADYKLTELPGLNKMDEM